MIILRLQQLLLYYIYIYYIHMYTVYISNQLLGLFRNRNPHRQCLRLHDAPGCCPTELVISTHQRGFHSPTLMLKSRTLSKFSLKSIQFPPFSQHFHHFPSIFPAFSQHFPSMFSTISHHFPRCSARFGVWPNGCRTHPGGSECLTWPHRGDGAGTGL